MHLTLGKRNLYSKKNCCMKTPSIKFKKEIQKILRRISAKPFWDTYKIKNKLQPLPK